MFQHNENERGHTKINQYKTQSESGSEVKNRTQTSWKTLTGEVMTPYLALFPSVLSGCGCPEHSRGDEDEGLEKPNTFIHRSTLSYPSDTMIPGEDVRPSWFSQVGLGRRTCADSL